jgi:hypothetical protein
VRIGSWFFLYWETAKAQMRGFFRLPTARLKPADAGGRSQIVAFLPRFWGGGSPKSAPAWFSGCLIRLYPMPLFLAALLP